jgi:hypothetical protein
MMRKVNFKKWLVDITWLRFLAVSFVIYCAFIGVFSAIFYYSHSIQSQPSHAQFEDSVFHSQAMLIGDSSSAPLTRLGRILSAIERIVGILLFGVFLGIVLTRIGKPRTKLRLASRVAIYEAPEGLLLEFRFIVHPSAPVYAPEIHVSLFWITAAGDRENTPLELTPVQAMRIRYYLVFRAIVPKHILKKGVRPAKNPLRALPPASVEVYIRVVDSASDEPVVTCGEFNLPADAEAGMFCSAVALGQFGNIIGLDESSLERITPIENQ